MNKKGYKGYKVFNPDWTCRGFQYEVGKTYEQDLIPDVCNRGFHFCKNAADCFKYYSFNPLNKVAEIIAYGEVAEDGDKCATNKIEIVREIPWTELLDIVMLEFFGFGWIFGRDPQKDEEAAEREERRKEQK